VRRGRVSRLVVLLRPRACLLWLGRRRAVSRGDRFGVGEMPWWVVVLRGGRAGGLRKKGRARRRKFTRCPRVWLMRWCML
jgi:hypothetical protein